MEFLGCEITANVCGPVGTLEQLQELCFAGNEFVTDDGIEQIARLTNLRRLELFGIELSDVSVAQLEKLTQLQSLSIEGPRITDAGVAHLAGLSHLQQVSIDSSCVTDAGLMHLQGLTNLKWFGIRSSSGLSVVGVRHLEGLRRLRHLILPPHTLTSEELRQVQKAMPACKIRQ